MNAFKFIAVILLFTLCSGVELGVASLIKDHMVLQRDQVNPIWGRSTPGQKVTVEFKGQSKTVVSDDQGAWRVNLDPSKASEESERIRISTSSGEEVTVEDVLVGEVWICSGQSNMEMSAATIPELPSLISKVKHIRSFEVEQTVAFTEQDTCIGEWKKIHPNSAVAASFAYFLKQHVDVPLGIILTCWGSSSIEAWMPRDMVDTVPHFKTMMEEFDADIATKNMIQGILDGPRPFSRADNVFIRRQSNILYNAMIHPLAPYACKGIVWYQGERNTKSMHGMVEQPWFARNSGMIKYGDTLKAWIQRYRQEWENDEMQLLAVMLPGYLGKTEKLNDYDRANDPTVASWAWMRESQMKVLEVSNTAVANTIDLGHISNIHPKDKLPIGERLALLAARDIYGQDIIAQGPVLKRVEVIPGKMVVHFDQVDGLITTDGEAPRGFWVTDESQEWVPAQAEINGKTLVLSSDKIEKPLYVRYAFSGKPDVNLVNDAGLPAYPFRSDTFPSPEE